MEKTFRQKSTELIKKKHRTWKRYINTKDVKVYIEYRKITNKVRKCTRDINRNEQCEVAKNVKDNPKKFWNYVNGKRKCKDRIGNLDYINPDGHKMSAHTDDVKAETLNKFFSSVFSQENDYDFSTLPPKHAVIAH